MPFELKFARPVEATAEVAPLVRSPRRLLPAQAAIEGKLCDKEGREWSADVAPYMVDPLNDFAGRRYQEIIFVGPARTSKTFTLVHGAINYAVTCDPGDMHVIQMTHDAARAFSKDEVAPVIRHSEGLSAAMSSKQIDNNTFDKRANNGMLLAFGWPAVSQLSSYTAKYMISTDYDRPSNRDNVDGEGPLFDLMTKRVATYMSRGKALAESSPGEDYLDASWSPTSPHEAPPALGIAALYNGGTRGRFYWRCKGCGHRFQAAPGPEIFDLPDFRTLQDLVMQATDLSGLVGEYARVSCKRCGTMHTMSDRRDLNLSGRWLHEGERFDAQDRIVGERRKTPRVSYWLGGAAAAFQRWDSMLRGYFEAVRTFVQTGDEGSLRTKTNVDFGASYMPRAAAMRRRAEDLMNRAEDYVRGVVPFGVQFLTAAVDVQMGRFVVVVYGWGADREAWVIERFSITHNPDRLDPSGRPDMVNPAANADDWDLIETQVMDARYPLVEDPSVTVPIYVVGCDSGGQAGVHARAYDFWRKMRDKGRGVELKLLKGAATDTAPRIEERWPDARTKEDRATPSRGDVPVWFLNTTTFKDEAVGDLALDRYGPRFVHLPKWLDRRFFGELVAESRGPKGWVKSEKRNEQFDLHVYNRALYAVIGAERIDWSNPPLWARRPQPVSENAEARATIAGDATLSHRMEKLAKGTENAPTSLADRMAALVRR